MALKQSKLAQKRARKNLKRKGKTYKQPQKYVVLQGDTLQDNQTIAL